MNIEPALDRNGALERLGGDETLYQEILALFLDDARAQIQRMWDANKRGNADSLIRAAHSLRSSAGSVGAPRLQAVCGKLEQLIARTKPTLGFELSKD